MKTNLLRAAIFTPNDDGGFGVPVLLWGLPGVAKTAILRQLAQEYGMPIEVLSPAARGEGAFGVTPVPIDGKMTYPPPVWVEKFEEAGRGIVFVDEINLAATHYAGALLGLLQDRIIGSEQLPKGVRVLAAANPIDLAAASGGWDLSAPAANRVGHIEWKCPDVKTWSDWLMSDVFNTRPKIKDAAEEEQRVLEAWPSAWGDARGAVTGFLSANMTHLHAMPQNGSANMSKAWPSPRTWTFATRALASSQVHRLSEIERDEFIGAFVGDGVAGEFLTWMTKANLPNSADLLDGKVKWEHKVSRLDVTTAVFGSATALCLSTPAGEKQAKRSEKMWELLGLAAKTSPDLIVSPAKTLVGAKLFGSKGIEGLTKTASKIMPILEAANIKF